MDAVRYDVADEVATITLDDPDRRNTLGPELVDRLGGYLEAAMGDDAVRVVIVTNTGSTFCAGADLSASRPGPERQRGRSFSDVFTTMLDGPKPVVGRIAGHCVGGGVGLAAACDLSVAADDVKVGFTEVRIGVSPAMISVVCLPKMRHADAAELMLTGERVLAPRAVEVGLLTRAVPRDDLDAAVDAITGQLRSGGPRALAATKQLLQKVPTMSRQSAFDWTTELSARLFESDEAAAGIAAFRERRPAPWAPSAG